MHTKLNDILYLFLNLPYGLTLVLVNILIYIINNPTYFKLYFDIVLLDHIGYGASPVMNLSFCLDVCRRSLLKLLWW